jgi:hypothetical protein
MTDKRVRVDHKVMCPWKDFYYEKFSPSGAVTAIDEIHRHVV